MCTDVDNRPLLPLPERQLAVLESVCSTRTLRETLSTGSGSPSRRLRECRPMELAEGFEPPTG